MTGILFSTDNLSKPVRYLPIAFVMRVPEETEMKDLFRLIMAKKPALFENKRNSVWGSNIVLSFDLRSCPHVVQEAFQEASVPVFAYQELVSA